MKKYIINNLIITGIIMIVNVIMVFGQNPGDELWSTSLGWYVNSVSEAGDVDGDGYSDIFVGSSDNLTYCLSGKDGSILWSWNTTMEVWSVATLADVNGDGIDDCLAGTGNDTLYCFSGKPSSGTTEIIWSMPTEETIWTVASISDVNGDGINDCLAGTAGNRVYCFDGNYGHKLWTYAGSSDILTVSSIPDVNADDKDDCIAGGHQDSVVCISGTTGELIWYYKINKPKGASILSVATIEDVDGDGVADCIAGGLDEMVYCLSGASQSEADVIWTYPTGANIESVAPISDVDGDGYNDCLAGGYDDKVFCISGNTGNLIWSYNTIATVYDVESIPDVNSDGIDDCIAGAADDSVHCIDGRTGTGLWINDMPKGTVLCVTSISDITNNGFPEVVAGSNDSYVYVFEGGEEISETVSTPDIPEGPSTGYVNENLTFTAIGAESNLGHELEYRFNWGKGNYSNWNGQIQIHSWQSEGIFEVKVQARCSVHKEVVSNWSDGLSVDIYSTGVGLMENSQVPEHFKLFQNHPNPFNSETIINFHIPQYEQVVIEIFNVEGVLISKPVNNYFQPGRYTIRWRGKDKYGISLPTGVYFYRLQASDFSHTRSMLYVK